MVVSLFLLVFVPWLEVGSGLEGLVPLYGADFTPAGDVSLCPEAGFTLLKRGQECVYWKCCLSPGERQGQVRASFILSGCAHSHQQWQPPP